MTRHKFTVTYEPDEGGWHAQIHDVSGCHTWGRSLAAARKNIREALSTCEDVFGQMTDRIATEAELVDDIRLPKRVAGAVKACRKARERLEAEENRVRDATREAVKILVEDARLSVRDAGDLLGISHQRIAQVKAG